MAPNAPAERVLIIAPVGQDASIMAATLGAQGISTFPCPDPGEALRQLQIGAGAFLLTEEALELPGASALLDALKHQPPWSELPIIILTSGGESRLTRLLKLASSFAGSATLLERPMRLATLLGSVQVALHSRRRQYQVRDLLAEQQRQQEELRQSEERLRKLADSIPNMAWWAKGDGSATWYNQRWFDYTGTTPEQMEGEGWRIVHDPQMLPQVMERWKNSLATGEPFEMELPLRAADGRFRWFLTRVIPVRDPEGNVARWFGTSTDITDIRDARQVLARDKEQLDTLVKERTAKLQEMVGELEHFSYTITHDMRAPLRAMRGIAEIISESEAEWPAAERTKFIRRIITAAERMDGLITDALHYSKVVRSELPLAPVDPGELLRGMLETYPEFQSRDAEILLPESFPLVMGNEAGLTQCFSNLLGNAVKFVKPGQKARVRVRVERVRSGDHPAHGLSGTSAAGPRIPGGDGEWIRLWVEDAGIGISESMKARVFDMFSRGSNPRAGAGIGLALVRKVVHRMGGRVGVESEEGKGTRFWVELRPGDAPQAA